MKKSLGILLLAAAVAVLAAGLVALYAMNRNGRAAVACSGVRVEYADPLRFVSEAEIGEYLAKDYGPCIGKRLDSLDLQAIETLLEGKSAILKTEAFTTPDGFLNLRIRQREPVIRFQKGANGFYADERGFLFPLHGSFSSPVSIVDGAIPLHVTEGYKGEARTEAERKWLQAVIAMTGYMQHSSWNGFFSQITVEENGDLVLIPREGEERFVFGAPDDVTDKFRRIQEYYTAIAPARKGAGEKGYRTVNVKYKHQIICK